MAGDEAPAKKSDLGVRTLSAIVMVAVAGTALWLGGWVWTAFVVTVALGVLWEWSGLVAKFGATTGTRSAWSFAGLIYIGLAVSTLWYLRDELGNRAILAIVLSVIGTDVGAYFAGRSIGGPKIAPKISPSKTWAGLAGGVVGAGSAIALVIALATTSGTESFDWGDEWHWLVVTGTVVAIVAQAGDFFESWMKRRAGVKDSGRLIPGHGGLFDRVDGLLAVSFMIGLVLLAISAAAAAFDASIELRPA